ncbi:FAD-dependent oxidoreductase [Streptomyces sp. NPDC127106]|uniref:FAD-dependent oxidoreductase n=1 Tax=Streptomyces sp. NPDC127106 TaxID=3345360 RepID=UPI003630A95C
MKILLTLPGPGLAITDFLRSGNVVHDPSADSATDDTLLDALILHGARALITTRRPDDAVLRAWAEHTAGPVHVAYAVPVSAELSPAQPPVRSVQPGQPVQSVQPVQPVHLIHPVHEFSLDGTGLDAIAAALAHCERTAALARPVPSGVAPEAGGPRDAFLIGAGVVNLVTALHLADHGYRVTVVDRSPAPGTAGWQAYGCTHAGDDARMSACRRR